MSGSGRVHATITYVGRSAQAHMVTWTYIHTYTAGRDSMQDSGACPGGWSNPLSLRNATSSYSDSQALYQQLLPLILETKTLCQAMLITR